MRCIHHRGHADSGHRDINFEKGAANLRFCCPLRIFNPYLSADLTTRQPPATLVITRCFLGKRARPNAHPKFLADHFKLRLTPGEFTRQADDEPRHARANRAHIAQLRQDGGNGAIALGVNP